MLHACTMIYIIVIAFSWTKILTQCQVPVDVFCMFFVSQFIPRKYREKIEKNTRTNNFSRRTHSNKFCQQGGPPGDHVGWARRSGLGRGPWPQVHPVHRLLLHLLL